MADLAMGANAPLEGSDVVVTVELPSPAVDITALLIYANGKVRGDGDMCFYGQLETADGSVRLTQDQSPRFGVDLTRLPVDVEKIVLTATIDGPGNFGDLGDLSLTIGQHTLNVPGSGRTEAALILAEIYQRNSVWKVRNVGQGFNGGLRALATHFGVEVVSDSEAPPPPAPATPTPTPATPAPAPPAPAPTVNLSKVSLTKQSSSVSLKKNDGKFGKIRINLNWNQKKSGGFFGMGKTGIDLDIGAFVELTDGTRTVIQALGGNFGTYDRAPFLKLLGDDRTGSVSDGEWIEINGDSWSSIRRVLVFAFIYEGVANWQETDGVVRVLVPNQPEVEVRMNEYGSRDTMCGVAGLLNDNGQIRIDREVSFFPSHKELDEAYGWGFRWKAGSK
jgi:tellurite resistance protein TerA